MRGGAAIESDDWGTTLRTSRTLRHGLRGLAGIGTAALIASSMLVAAPAHAAESITYTVPGLQDDFVVPANVSSITYTVVGGAGGDASGVHGGLGGWGAQITGTFDVKQGDVLEIWVGGAGQDGGGTGEPAGIGGVGFAEGGDGGGAGFDLVGPDDTYVSFARPGAGGGGSSAVLLNTDVVVAAAGGGGGGGRGLDDVVFDACTGGFGGDAGLAGGASAGGDNAPYAKCPSAAGGSAGVAALAPGGDAADVPESILNTTVGGAGGGGAGDGGAGNYSLAPNAIFVRAAGGGGGAGGASFQDIALTPDAEITVPPTETETGDGYVTLEWVVALPATGAAVNLPLFAGGALMLLLAGGALFVLRQRSEHA